jgi:hypothetical protein
MKHAALAVMFVAGTVVGTAGLVVWGMVQTVREARNPRAYRRRPA